MTGLCNLKLYFSLFIVALVLLAPTGSKAQGLATPTARIVPEEIREGDFFSYTVEAASDFTPIGFPITSDANVRLLRDNYNRSARTQMLQGRLVQQSYTYSWQFQALKPGDFSFQPMQVQHNGQTITLPAIKGTVKQIERAQIAQFENAGRVVTPDRSIMNTYGQRYFTTVEVSEESPVLYQPVQVTTVLYREASDQTMRTNFEVASNPGGSKFVLVDQSTRLLSPYKPETIVVQGTRYVRTPLQSAFIVPTQTGAAEINGAELGLNIGDMNSFFFSNQVYFQISAPSVSINVQPVPEQAGDVVTQLVGDFTIGVVADSERVQQGDLITITIRISGRGFLEMTSLGNMPDIPGLTFLSEEVTTRNNQPNQRLHSDKQFKRVYQASEAGKLTIPSFKFAVYDPWSKQQQVRDTQVLTVNVKPSAKSSFNLAATDNANRGTARTLSEGGGIMYIDLQPMTTNRFAAGRPIGLRPVFWLLHTIPLLLVIAWGGWSARQRRLQGDIEWVKTKSSRQRAQVALKEARAKQKHGSSPEFYAALSAGLLNYIAAVTKRNASGLTAEDAARELTDRGAEPAITEQLVTLLERCDEMRYAPAANHGRRDADMDIAENIISIVGRIK